MAETGTEEKAATAEKAAKMKVEMKAEMKAAKRNLSQTPDLNLRLKLVSA